MSERTLGAYDPELQAIATFTEGNEHRLMWRRVWYEGYKSYTREGLDWLRIRYAATNGEAQAVVLANNCNLDLLSKLDSLVPLFEVANVRMIFKDLDGYDKRVVAGILDINKNPIYRSPGIDLKSLQEFVDTTGESFLI